MWLGHISLLLGRVYESLWPGHWAVHAATLVCPFLQQAALASTPHLLPRHLEGLNGAVAGSMTTARSSSRPAAGVLGVGGLAWRFGEITPQGVFFAPSYVPLKQLEEVNVLCGLYTQK